MKINIFVDMDGVLAWYDPETAKKMYNEGHFENLPPHKGNLTLVKELIGDPTLEVYTLSSLLADSPYIEAEKHKWLDKYLPELDSAHRILVPEGIDKATYVKEVLPSSKYRTNVLLDDYTANLLKWKDHGNLSIKVLNGINNSHGIWLSENPESFLSYHANPAHNYKKITRLITSLNTKK